MWEEIMKILILGIDGYIGWPLALHLTRLGYEVTGLDNLFRRHVAKESLIPIESAFERNKKIKIHGAVLDEITEIPKVDVIVHLAEQPSAPWSMIDHEHACITQKRNIMGTLNLLWLMRKFCPDAHLIKLGTMGEYGTPDCEIPEGFIEDGPMKGLPFPRVAGSFYHLSKVFDSQNIEFSCRTWGLRSTDIMQGVVFGHLPGTRFDYDQYFGTVINRFCVQAVSGMPLTVYGAGGQTRGYLPLRDSIECLTLAINNPPKPGEYRVFNQFARTLSVNSISETVMDMAWELGITALTDRIKNPRVEKETHTYFPKHDHLEKLGYQPNWIFREEIGNLIKIILPYKDRINKEVIMPTTRWN
jgi:UDP-sulfoquinovose synthase